MVLGAGPWDICEEEAADDCVGFFSGRLIHQHNYINILLQDN